MLRVQVLAVVGLGGRAEDHAAIERRGGSPLRGAQIRHQRHQIGVGPAADAIDQRFGVRHLRHQLGGDEGRDLDLAQAGIQHCLDDGDLALGRYQLALDLQTVAGADLDNFDPVAGAGRSRGAMGRRGLGGGGHLGDPRRCRARARQYRSVNQCSQVPVRNTGHRDRRWLANASDPMTPGAPSTLALGPST
jgi:hypothetical protein